MKNENITLSYLRTKVWYRAVKVVYFTASLLIFGFIIVLFFNSNEFDVLDVGNSKIVCQYGNEKTFLVKDNFDMEEISISGYSDLMFSTSDQEKINILCEIDKSKVLKSGVWRIIEYRIEKKFTKDIVYLLIVILIILTVLEGLRRAFYYITLGALFPKK